MRSEIEKLNERAIHSIRFRLGSVFETSWSLCGFEKFLLDLSLDPRLPSYMIERVSEVHLENMGKVLNVAGDLIDIAYFYDDIATQQGLLISPEMYEEFVQPFHQRIINVCEEFNIPVMMHCCGSVYSMIGTFIRMGLRILNPIQPTAKDMEPERLKEKFGEELVFHGGIDIQHFLPSASAAQVKDEVKRISQVLGRQGGYIMSGSHHIQAETPVENILAMYGALKQ
jgi:uroporphyrinogen decarboxylase